MAFASMKYPPGSFPPGGVYGEGSIFEQLPLQDGGKRLSVGSSGSGGGSRSRIGSSDYGSQQHMSHSRSHGMLVSPRTSGTAAAAAAAARSVAGGQRHHGSGIRSNEASPVIGAATTPTGNRAGASGGFGVQGGSPAAVSSGRGTPGPPPGLGSANPGFSPSSVSNVSTHSVRSVGAFSTESASSLSQQRQVRHNRGASGGGGGGKGDDEKGTHEVDLDYFDFGELDTAAVLGL
ncbi:unnamed protein product [Ectocarpus sp. 8 AP-2014]